MPGSSTAAASKPDAGLRWAPDVRDSFERFVASAASPPQVLVLGAGASARFLLRLGAHVTVIERNANRLGSLEDAARRRGFADRLIAVPWAATSGEPLGEGGRYDALVVAGVQDEALFAGALARTDPAGPVVHVDPHGASFWPAFRLQAAKPCITHEVANGTSSIWQAAVQNGPHGFAIKEFRHDPEPVAPMPSRTLVPGELFASQALEPGYVHKEPLRDLAPVEARLQDLRLIERTATYVAPNLFELRGSSLRIDAGHKMLRFGDAVYRGKGGAFARSDETPLFDGAIDLPGRTLDLTASGAGRYSFFLLDSLPKLELVAAAGFSLDDFDTILVNSTAAWLRDMLALAIGGADARIVAFSRDTPSVRMERSVHIEGIRSARFTPRWVHEYLARTFRIGTADATPDGGETFGPNIYISRQKAEGRRILNHEAFLATIRQWGFVEVFAEDHSPLDLAMRLRNAQTVISPHGAGLANILFAPSGANVVELFSSHYTPQYFHLSRDCGHHYHALGCKDASGRNVFDRYTPETRNKAEFNREDIDVDLKELEIRLTGLCGASTAGKPRGWVNRLFRGSAQIGV